MARKSCVCPKSCRVRAGTLWVPYIVEAGRPVAEIAEQLGVTGQTIYNWRNQDLIDRGIRPGVTTTNSLRETR